MDELRILRAIYPMKIYKSRYPILELVAILLLIQMKRKGVKLTKYQYI